MIGLTRHIVRIVSHDPNWATLFSQERDVLRRALNELVVEIEHVGSTAVPDLPAKPILDIAIAARTLAPITPIVERLVGIGYIYRGDGGDAGGHFFVKESEPNVRTVHVHVVEEEGAQWKNYVFFRDTLLRSEKVRSQYADLKGDLMRRFPGDRLSYTSGKEDFVQAILRSRCQLPPL